MNKLTTKKPLLHKSWLIALALPILATFAIIAITQTLNSKDAEALSGFNPGNIIADSKMADTNAMNEDQIRSFINSRNANCANGNSMCFRNYREDGKDAARIIFEASREQRINPQVILVTIQKEQGLVTSTNPQQWMYNSAMGYACPDSTPGRCGANERGFMRQVVWGSTMYRAILDGGGSWSNRYTSGTRWYTPYIVGTNTVQWSPTASCGSSQLRIENRATQALYNYTPYRPNQAALNAGYGTGDGCSAYGNRNFFLYMRDWFGYAATANAYTWSSAGQRVFADAARTQPLPYNAVLHPGQTVYAEIKARNTGSVPWTDNARLGTFRKQDRPSPFYGEGWIDKSRAARLVESSVAPGNIGTFRFTLTAPMATGTFNEYFNIVLEGQAWLNDIGLYLPIKVVNTREVQLFSDPAHTTPISDAKANVDDPVYAKLRLTNNTSSSLPANTRIATTSPDDRKSSLQHSSWISPDRVVQLGRSVEPGQSTDVNFTLEPQSTIKTVDENFGLVIDGVSWVDRDSIKVKYETKPKPITPPVPMYTDNIKADASIPIDQALTSPNLSYKLVLQGDGNLVLYSGSRALWSTGTVGSRADRLVMQGDGNLVLYSGSRALWSTGTVGSRADRLVMQGDGNLVLYSPSRAVWATGTNR